MASTYLQRTMGTATNRNIFTLSMWVKLSKLGSDLNDFQFCDFYVSGSIRISLYQNDDDTLRCHMEGGGSYTNNLFTTSAKIRDTNAWYHLVWRFDTTQATASDRVRVYINGELATFSDYNPPTQNFNLQQGTSSYTQYIGKYGGSTDNNFDGVMSHIHFCDGYSYDASAFGSTDSTTGEWKINTSPSVSYGNNGFFILKDGNSVTDQSGEGNNFTVGGGTLTKTEDCPSNVFATFNPLTSWLGQNRTPSQSINKGNLTTGIGSSEKAMLVSTIGVTSGKYYWEAKSDGVSKLFYGFSNYLVFGTSADPHTQGGYNGVYYYEGTGSADYRTYGSNTSTTGISNISSGDILGFALDMDNYAFYIHKNGTYMNSGSPTSGSSRTGSIPELFTYGRNCLSDYGEVFATAYVTSTSGSGTASFNFGNGYFGLTAVSSAGTNASGIGIFEYDVPAGYTALSTKGLNE